METLSTFVSGDDWSACRVLLQGPSVIVIPCYLTGSIDATGINMLNLTQMIHCGKLRVSFRNGKRL